MSFTKSIRDFILHVLGAEPKRTPAEWEAALDAELNRERESRERQVKYVRHRDWGRINREEFGFPFQEHIDSGRLNVEDFDRFTSGDEGIPNLASKFLLSEIRTDSEAHLLRNDVVVTFYPSADATSLSLMIEDRDLFVDADGNDVAKAKLGVTKAGGPTRIPMALGATAFIEVEWLTDDPIARRVARLKKAPWVTMVLPDNVRGLLLSKLGYLHEQVRLDVAAGNTRPEYAWPIDSKTEGDAAEFFVRLIQGAGDVASRPNDRNYEVRSIQRGADGFFYVGDKRIWPPEGAVLGDNGIWLYKGEPLPKSLAEWSKEKKKP